MDRQNHFVFTVIALFLFGVIALRPDALHPKPEEERVCKLLRGKMDCFFKQTGHKVNHRIEMPL
jgi:hypothetical protein